jgi:hypothetical protein
MVGLTTADQGNVMKWRVIVELTGSDDGGHAPIRRVMVGRRPAFPIKFIIRE